MKALANSSPCALLFAAATNTAYHAGRSGAAEDAVCAPAATAQSWHFSRATASLESKRTDENLEASAPHSWHGINGAFDVESRANPFLFGLFASSADCEDDIEFSFHSIHSAKSDSSCGSLVCTLDRLGCNSAPVNSSLKSLQLNVPVQVVAKVVQAAILNDQRKRPRSCDEYACVGAGRPRQAARVCNTAFYK
jgi:hypothetical protein